MIDPELLQYAQPEELELLTALTQAQLRRTNRALYYRDPVAYVYDHYPGLVLAPHQEETLTALAEHHRVSVRAGRGAAKTSTASLGLLWFAQTREDAGRDWKVPTTASVWRQLTHFLWPEVHKWARLFDWSKVGRGPYSSRTELMTMQLSLPHGSAFAAASNQPDTLEGAHADSLLYILDESKAIPDTTFDAIEGAFAGNDMPGLEGLQLMISTPGAPAGRFYQVQSRQPGYEDWYVKHVTLDEAIAAGRVSPRWVERRRRQWGEASALFQQQVLGEFAASDEESVIPLAWAEAAIERGRAAVELGGFGPLKRLGVDVGRGGDASVIAPLHEGDVVAPLRRDTAKNVMSITGKVAGLLEAHPSAVARVDVIGIGAGVFDRLREKFGASHVDAFNASESTDKRDASRELGFVNKRSAAWWHLRELLDPARPDGATLALPPSDLLLGDLTSPRWEVTSGGKIKVESKDTIRERLGRSTDDGDAVVMACWESGSGPAVTATATRRHLVKTPISRYS